MKEIKLKCKCSIGKGGIKHVHNCLYFSHIKIFFSDLYLLFYNGKATLKKKSVTL